jgi:hypothetical protein
MLSCIEEDKTYTLTDFVLLMKQEEPTVSGDTSLGMMETTALCCVSVKMVAAHLFSLHVSAFLDREFPDH